MSANRVWAQPVAVAVPDQVVTSIQEYWDLTTEQKSRPVSFEMQCYVTYFDPFWKMLYVQDLKGVGAYVPYGSNPYPFKSGQRILATGVFAPPNLDVTFEHATIVDQGAGWPEAAPTAGRIFAAGGLVSQFVSVEGLVDRYRRLAPGHLQLMLSVEGRPVVVWMQVGLDAPIPPFDNAIVRAEGVYNAKIGADGKMSSLEIMVPTLTHLQVINYLEGDPRFKLPFAPISSLAKASMEKMVRVVGQVKAQESGRLVRIRDDTGQIDVMTGQTRPCAINERIEAVGYPDVHGTEWRLTSAIFRTPATRPDLEPGVVLVTAGPLRLAAQVLELSPEEVMEERKVLLSGVVTWSHPAAPFFYIQDASGGICILRGQSDSTLRSPGRLLEVEGVTAMGQFAPLVKASRFDKLSDMVLPIARQVSLEHALTGAEEAQWVEMRGYLRQIQVVAGMKELELATSAGDFVAMLPASEDVSAMVGAVIRLHGVCTATANDQRKLTGIKLLVPSADYVQVEEAAPADLFDVPARSLASLGQFNGVQSFARRIRVSGTVLHHFPGHLIHIEENGDSLLVLARSLEPLNPGDRIDVVGFPGWQGGRVVLREATYRKTGRGTQPAPQLLAMGKNPMVDEDGKLVTIDGSLIGISRAADQVRLTMQTSHTVFEAYLEGAPSSTDLMAIPPGSRLSLIGVYEIKFDETGQPTVFLLNLRTPGDVTVLESPSWWTRARILGFTGALALGTLLFIAWVTALRRRVSAQTAQIREQLKRESWLESELQRAGKLESLGLLAGGIAHDFNNLLTVMMGNISLAGFDENLTPDTVKSLRTAERAAVRARDLTQQLLTFAKGGAPIRGAVSLPEVVREVADFALRGATTRCQYDIPANLWPVSADKGQIGQVVQNIVINAMQAMRVGGLIEISLRNESVGEDFSQMLVPGGYVHLMIRDHGPGISPEDLQHIFDPYFTTKKQGNGLGLATVYSIVKKHLGHISADSVVGQGTTFNIWLPVADTTPADESMHPLPTVNKKVAARVLFMDDEESICQLGCAILSRLGHETVTVPDGEAVLKSYQDAQAAGRPFDLVILDLTIPGGMGGREAMEKLLLLDPNVKSIVSSGYSNDLVLSDYQSYGFRGIVTKPYEISDFSRAIEKVLNGEKV